jgi:hypothetical protein
VNTVRAIGRRIGLVVAVAILAAASLTACRDQTVSEPSSPADPSYYYDQPGTGGYNRSFDDPFENSYDNHEQRMKQWSDPCPNGPAYC